MKSKTIYHLLTLLVSVPATLWVGFVFQKLWLWFLVSMGAPEISLARALGISLLVHYFIPGNFTKETKDLEGLEYFSFFCGEFLLGPAVALGVGFIYKSFL